MTGWHRDYDDPCLWRSCADKEQKRVGWETWVRMEKIIATVLREAHERQVGEAMDALEEGPESFYKSHLAGRRTRASGGGSRTPAEAARVLHVPLRRVLEWLAAGEIEAEQDPVSGQWMIPEDSLKGPEPVRQTQEELAWAYEKERLLIELHEWKARAELKRERAEGLRAEVEGLRKDLEVGRLRQGRRRGTSEA